MYPTLYDAIKDLTGLEIGLFKIFMTFGFFVALSFLAAYAMMVLELKRKESEPGMISKTITKTIGGPVSWSDWLTTGIFGFFMGWKGWVLLTDFSSVSSNVQGFLISTQGNIFAGIVVAIGFIAWRYRDYTKERLDEPKKIQVHTKPYQHMGEITVQAAIFGIIGAKVFHLLEYPEQFTSDPIGSLVSFSGLTFLGGLLVGGWAVIARARKRGIPPLKMLDVGAPAMMLAYGVGRMGCQFSGDGDWGIVNKAPKPDWMSFLPDWMWSYNYPNNVIKECNPYTGDAYFEHQCSWAETPYLIDPVFPTPFYEIVMALALFGILWLIRKKIRFDGGLFGVYLVFAGVERFLIEKIRVNSKYNLGGFEFTQAELLSSIMIIGGIALFIWARNRSKKAAEVSA